MSIHTKTALDYIRRSPFQALAAIFVLAVTFFVVTISALLIFSSGRLLSYFETRPQVIAFLKDEVDASEISLLQNQLIADSRVENVSYVSKEEALAIYKEATSDNPLLSELVSPSIFPASLEFSLTDLEFAEEVIEEIGNESIVEQVGFTASLGGEANLSDVVSRLRTITRYVRIGGITFAGLLGGTSFMVLIVIISMRMSTRRKEIEILDLLGATPGFIRSPIILEAVIYSILGVLMGWVLSVILVLYTTPSIIAYFGQIPVLPKDTASLLTLLLALLAAELVIGFFLALMGSSIAVSRARRKK